MAPKVKITKEDIIKTALELTRICGEGSINARSVATALGCSTQPVFSNFASMAELKRAVIVAAYNRYTDFISREVESGEYPRYKSFGMAYVRFAKEERELFRLLFMRDRSDEELTPTPDFEEAVKMIMDANGVGEERARLMHLELWAFVHGIGTMLATSFLPLDLKLVSDMLTDVYQGIRARNLSEGNK